METATKSGLNYSPAIESVRSIPAATSTTAGIITSAQYTSLTETIPNKLIEIEETLEGKQDSGDYALSSEIPTKVSELTNDSGFITNSALTDYALKSEIPDISNLATKTEVAAKQDALVSGTNIKTINGTSLLGEGNIVIEGGGGSSEITDVLDNKIYGRTQGSWVDLTDYLT